MFQQATILREDLPGFIFESNRGTKHSFTAETSLGPEFAAGWTGKRGKRLRSKIEAMKQKVPGLYMQLILLLQYYLELQEIFAIIYKKILLSNCTYLYSIISICQAVKLL